MIDDDDDGGDNNINNNIIIIIIDFSILAEIRYWTKRLRRS